MKGVFITALGLGGLLVYATSLSSPPALREPEPKTTFGPGAGNVTPAYSPEPSKNGFAGRPMNDGSTVVPGSLSQYLPFVTIKNWSWKNGGFGAVMVADFTLRNENGFGVKDVLIKCETYGGSGTQIGEVSTTVYEIVAAHKEKTIRGLSVGFINSQAKSASCRIAHFLRA